MTDERKRCPRCGDTKPIAGFYVSASRVSGWCRECVKADIRRRDQDRTPAEIRAKSTQDLKRKNERRANEPGYVQAESLRQRKWAERTGGAVRGDPAAKMLVRDLWMRGDRAAAERIKHEANAAYIRRDPERFRIQCAVRNANRRARKRGINGLITYADWLATLVRHDHACAYCRVTGALLDLDHLVAMADGGDNTPANIVPACRPCNGQKWARALSEFCALRGLDEAKIRARAAA